MRTATFYASLLDLDLPAGAAENAFTQGEFYAANLFWSPATGGTFGLELIHATRRVQSGPQGDGTRLQFSARVDF